MSNALRLVSAEPELPRSQIGVVNGGYLIQDDFDGLTYFGYWRPESIAICAAEPDYTLTVRDDIAIKCTCKSWEIGVWRNDSLERTRCKHCIELSRELHPREEWPFASKSEAELRTAWERLWRWCEAICQREAMGLDCGDAERQFETRKGQIELEFQIKGLEIE